MSVPVGFELILHHSGLLLPSYFPACHIYVSFFLFKEFVQKYITKRFPLTIFTRYISFVSMDLFLLIHFANGGLFLWCQEIFTGTRNFSLAEYTLCTRERFYVLDKGPTMSGTDRIIPKENNSKQFINKSNIIQRHILPRSGPQGYDPCLHLVIALFTNKWKTFCQGTVNSKV